MGISSKTRPLNREGFHRALAALLSPTDPSSCVIAYSGGVDSHVLLHLCVSLGLPVRAVHVHHGLQAAADDWVDHCQRVCDALDVGLQVCRIDARARRGDSPEAAAREARYLALSQALSDDEILLLGQHKNDQAETVLLQMLRGSGVAGLAAMPAQSRLHGGQPMLRPLLGFSRRQIEHYARRHRLDWVEDPSNRQTHLRRNALRQHIVPALEEYWPQAVESLHQLAARQQDAQLLLDDLAQIDLARCIGHAPERLQVLPLRGLPPRRRFNLLRYWLHARGTRPNRRCLEQIVRTVLTAAGDAAPVVKWGAHELRRFNGELYLLQQADTVALTAEYPWQPGREALRIDALGSSLHIVTGVSGALDARWLQQPLRVCFRRGGEKIAVTAAQHRQSLKKLFQQAAIPPWQRQRIPLLYHGNELLAVCGHWLSAPHCVSRGEDGWMPRLQA